MSTYCTCTDWVKGEGRAVGDGGVFAEENKLVDSFRCEFFPTLVQVILFDNTIVVLQQSHLSIHEASYTLSKSSPIETLGLHTYTHAYIENKAMKFKGDLEGGARLPTGHG